MLVFLLHSMKLLFTKPIPPNPAPSKIIPIISETLYIYLIGFQHGKHDMHPKQERMHEKAKPHKMKKPAPKAKHHAAKPKHHQEHRHEPH